MKFFDMIGRTTKNSKGADVKAEMIKAAFNGEIFCDDVVNCIKCEDAMEEHVPAILFGLTRATASFLKSLEKSDIHAKRLFEAMLNVWLNDVDDFGYFDNWTKKLREHRLGVK